LDHVLLVVKPSPTQQADLDQLLKDQQNSSSPNFHKWLTPEEYGARFGLSTSDHSKLVSWLTSQGLTVQETGRGRNWIAFAGPASRISAALQTEIHRYATNGKTHFANARDISVPAAFADVVSGFIGLNDFIPQPSIHAVPIDGNEPALTS